MGLIKVLNILFIHLLYNKSMHLNCGLPIELVGDKLEFKGIPQVAPQFRKASELKGVLFDKSFSSNEIIYLMYRSLKMPAHAALFQKHLLSYDITIILPKMLGTEFPKTLGHYHSLSKTVSYPEIYEVLSGRAHFLLQDKKAEEVVLVEACAGDIVIVPPDYGHVTINPGSEALVMSNLICINVKPDYESITAKGGAAYFETNNGFVKNEKCNATELRFIKAQGIKKRFFGSAKPMYDIFMNQPEKFEFLNNPEKHLKEMGSILRVYSNTRK